MPSRLRGNSSVGNEISLADGLNDFERFLRLFLGLIAVFELFLFLFCIFNYI